MKKTLYLLLIIASAWGCSKFDDYNTDPKNPSVVPAGPLFTNATRNLVDILQSTNVNDNVFRLYAQYWAETTYPDESQYNLVTRSNPARFWNTFYRDVLKDYAEAEKIITATETSTAAEAKKKQNQLSIITITKVYTYSILVDLFGDVPYTDALNSDNVLPKYDDAATIYNSLITNLNDAISKLDASSGAFSASEDLVYEGNVAQWIGFANSLKLRLALRIADVDASKAKTLATEAAAGVITSNAGNFSLTYYSTSPNTNPLWTDLVQSGRSDFVGANTFVNILNGLNDPRRSAYFTTVDGAYLGGTYGSANAYSNFSHPGDILTNPTLPGTLLNYAEVEFSLAEAVERGLITGSAEDHYQKGIKASILEWGGTEADFNTYYAQASVAYTTASGNWKQKIGIQKWISQYNQGFEGWTAWRQLDFTALTPPAGLNYSDIPVRFTYPSTEASLNPKNFAAAVKNIGGDKVSTKLFWDKN